MVTLSAAILLITSCNLALGGVVTGHLRLRDATPQLPFDPNTTSECTWWLDYTTSMSCQTIITENGISMEQFRRWNPSIDPSCGGLTTGRSYCVEAAFETLPPTTLPSTTLGHISSTTLAVKPSSTVPSNGIQTPLPVQPGLVSNCDAFYYVQSGDQCADIAAKHGISLAQFLQWNPKAGSTCGGLWKDAYACVSIIGHTPTMPSPTPTGIPNGVETPLPTQPGMVDNCDAFYFVQKGDNCASIAASNGITLNQFLQWNPKAGASCGGLWADAYACISIIGHTPTSRPTPTPTQPGNGIQTPTPIQSGMVKNCNKFHFVVPEQTCSDIQAQYRVTLANLVKWNPAIKADCTNMWGKTYLCVGVLS